MKLYANVLKGKYSLFKGWLYEDEETARKCLTHAQLEYSAIAAPVEVDSNLVAEIDVLRQTIDDVNCLIFAAGAPLGSPNYFAIREALCRAIYRKPNDHQSPHPTVDP